MQASDRNRKTGDIEKIFHLYYTPLCNYVLKFIGDKSASEDLVQDLFSQLLVRKELDQVRDIERYLLRSIKFKCIDYIRHKDSRTFTEVDELAEELPDQISDISEADIIPLFHYFTAKLPPKTRQIFLLSRTSGLTYSEIASELDISVKTVENQMSRALKGLRKLLKSHHFFSQIILLLLS